MSNLNKYKLNLNNKKHIRLFFESILAGIMILLMIKVYVSIESDIIFSFLAVFVATVFIFELFFNVKVLLNKPIISIDDDYLVIHGIFSTRKLRLSTTSFRFQKLMFRNHLCLKHSSKTSMIRCDYISDDLEMQLRKAFVQSKYGEVALENIKKALDY